jgi:hypothetical protein
MTTSPEIGELGGAMAKAQAQIKGAEQDSANPFFKSRYPSLESVREACIPALTAHGIAVFQSPSTDGAVVTVETLLVHSSGQWIRGSISATAKDDGPQAIGSVVSYLRRYSLQSFAGVAATDDDGEAAEGRGNGKANATAHLQQQPPLVAPKGYSAFVEKLQAAAMDGSAELEAEWKAGTPELRKHVHASEPGRMERLKDVAKKASAELGIVASRP